MKPTQKKPRAPRKPTLKQEKFIEAYLKTGNQSLAHKEAGFSSKSSGHASRLANRVPAVKAAIDEVRARVVEKIVYTAETAMNEANDAIAFARETGNANALVKAVELRSKLMGLLVDKTDIRMQQIPFSIKISGIDDEPPALPNTHAIDVTPEDGEVDIFS